MRKGLLAFSLQASRGRLLRTSENIVKTINIVSLWSQWLVSSLRDVHFVNDALEQAYCD